MEVSNKKEAQNATLQRELDLKTGVLDPQKDYPIEKYFMEWYKTFKRDISNIILNSYKATNRKANGFIRTCI